MLTAFKAKTLAKLYLESDPTKIYGATIAQLCDWLPRGQISDKPHLFIDDL
jgi:hypothetical protein